MKPVFSKFHEDNVLAIKTCAPIVRPLFYEFLRRIAFAGIPVRITCGKRTEAEQNAEYAKGRTAPGPVVTWVKGLDSYHVWGLAIDIAPLKQLLGFTYGIDYSRLTELEKIGKEIGVEHPWPIADGPHFMYTKGKTTQQLKNGEMIQAPAFDVLLEDDLTMMRVEERLATKGLLPLS